MLKYHPKSHHHKGRRKRPVGNWDQRWPVASSTAKRTTRLASQTAQIAVTPRSPSLSATRGDAQLSTGGSRRANDDRASTGALVTGRGMVPDAPAPTLGRD